MNGRDTKCNQWHFIIIGQLQGILSGNGPKWTRDENDWTDALQLSGRQRQSETHDEDAQGGAMQGYDGTVCNISFLSLAFRSPDLSQKKTPSAPYLSLSH